MNKFRRNFLESLERQIRKVSDQLTVIALDRMDYPDFDPDRAEQLTLQMIANGRLAVALPGHHVKNLCV